MNEEIEVAGGGAGESEADSGPDPIHRVVLRSGLGALVAGGAALFPLGVLSFLLSPAWARRQWLMLLLATLVSGASLGAAEGFARRTEGRKRVLLLVALGCLTALAIAALTTWVEGLVEGRSFLDTFARLVDLLESILRNPIMSAGLAVATALPFLAGSYGRTLGSAGPARLASSTLLTLGGGGGAVIFLGLLMNGRAGILVILFVVIPTSVIAALSLVDFVEPRLVAWLVKVTTPR